MPVQQYGQQGAGSDKARRPKRGLPPRAVYQSQGLRTEGLKDFKLLQVELLL